MQSQLFPSARNLFLTGQLDWTSGTWKAVLLPHSYTPTFAEEFLEDIPVAQRVAISEEIDGKTAVGGAAGCSAIELGLLLSPTICSKLVVYKDTGDEATSPVVLFVGDEGLTNEPFALLGFEYFVYPNATIGGLFRL